MTIPYPREFEFDVLLKDGEVIHLRPIKPEDAPLEAAFIARVGPQSMYQRFFRAKKELTPEELRYFTNVDYDERMALIALDGDRMVAVGRYDVSEESEGKEDREAEVAFLVEDTYQGRGIGALLLQHLTVYARLRGISGFNAFVLADNFGMMRLFRSSGYRVEPSLEEDVYRIDFPTDYSVEARAADWEHERRAVTASVAPLFYPRVIAVIGAQQGAETLSGRLLRNLLRGSYTGVVYPVNPDRTFVHSVTSYPSIGEVPDDVDLAFITLPPGEVIDAIGACGAKGVRAAVVTSWATVESRNWEDRLMKAARRQGLRMLGPDSSGLVVTNPEVGLHAHTGLATPLTGNVGLAIQSGAISSAILQDSARRGVGLSSLVSLGSAGDITANDMLIYWEGDPFTTVIALYVESVGTPRRFGRLARRIGRHKPVIAIKGGRTAIGSSGTESAAVDALFRSAGVIRAGTISEMFDVVKLLSKQPLPTSREVAVVGDEPGPASMLATALEAAGLDVPETLTIGEDQVANPVIVETDAMSGVIATLAESEVGAVAAVKVEDPVGPPWTVDIDEGSTPVVLVRMGVDTDSPTAPIPSYPYPEQAARALSSAFVYSEWKARPEGVVPEFPDVDRAGAEAFIKKTVAAVEGIADLDAEAVRELLHRYHLPVLAPQAVARVSLSMREDPIFGPLIRFSMAGELSRRAGDEAWRINPLTDVDAEEMIREVRSAGVLGERDADVSAIEELILRFSYLVEDHPEIIEMDLDPVAVGGVGSGVAVESARVVVRRLESRLLASRKDVPGRMA